MREGFLLVRSHVQRRARGRTPPWLQSGRSSRAPRLWRGQSPAERAKSLACFANSLSAFLEVRAIDRRACPSLFTRHLSICDGTMAGALGWTPAYSRKLDEEA